ncbi:MAG: trypsin-like peptidase domain-containing protein [Candidatus Pacebacteria bacterium]|nr:trypsin-like peptidase domain-containing protein [Candidatus Paceibacterota bacterium]MBP9780575.1 trypsin-like peptidase domain-containing protein [Candidatus Paceibacterota bacterium]
MEEQNNHQIHTDLKNEQHEVHTTSFQDTISKNFIARIKNISIPPFWNGVLGALVVFVVIAGVLYFYKGKIFNMLATDFYKESTAQLGGDAKNDEIKSFTQESFVVETVKKTNPAVVAIVVTKDVPKYETYYEQSNPFGNLFPGFSFETPKLKQNGTEKKEIGGGSGFFVSASGLLVTNRHVVSDKEAEYTVFTNDGKKHDAKVLARDSVLDIAVLQVSGSGFTYLEFANSDQIQVGQSVIAIGNALAEFRNTVSVGVVSGLARSITASDGAGKSELLDHVIQTDAAINPGNSGGPLLNLSGNVIGVNVAVAQGSENIGFALPANVVKNVVDSVRETGKIVRPYLGVRYAQITPTLKEKNNLSVDYGVIVSKGETKEDLAVIPGSPADKAGLLENDIILEADGKKLDSESNLSLIIRDKKVGDTLVLKVMSKGVTKDVRVVLEKAPEEIE